MNVPWQNLTFCIKKQPSRSSVVNNDDLTEHLKNGDIIFR